MPVGDVLIGDTGGDIEHDDTTLAVDIVTVTETTELLLAGGIPDVELNLTVVLSCCISNSAHRRVGGWPGTHGGEAQRVNLDTEGGHVLLLELASQVTLDEGGL